MSSRALAALLALLAVVAAGPTFAAAQSTATATPTDADNGTLAHDRTVMHVTLHGDGDATWRVRTDLDVADAQDRAAFRSLVDQYRSGRTDPPWLTELRTFNDAAERATGRQMAIRNESVTSNATNGTVTVRAHWTNFSRRDGEFLVARDAFNTTRGTWLDGLTEHQVLIIELPDRPVIRNAPKRVQNGQMRWEGPRDFEPGRPFVEFRASSNPTPAFPSSDVLLAGALAGGLVVLAYVAVRRVRPSVKSSAAESDGDEPASPEEAASAASDGDQVDRPPATSAADENGQEATEPEPVDEELLSDEERVERLLERNGGRMKQANIVKETGWSNAKVSQLLSSMAEEDRVDKLRIGRENLISFPDEDVTEIDEENH